MRLTVWITVAMATLGLLALALSQYRLVEAIVANQGALPVFVALPGEPHVRAETGGEPLAQEVAVHLPAAVAQVERALGRAFPRPVAVYVCATAESFRHYTGQARPRGTTVGERVFLAPRLAEQRDTIPQVLAHELTHLHQNQTAGSLRASRLPPWFREGLAVAISDGGGAENVTPAEAARAIRAGRHFDPADSDGWLFRRTAHDFGLTPHLFYRQSGLFLAWLRTRDLAAFASLLARIDAGDGLDAAFRAGYGAIAVELWPRFVAELPPGP